WPHPQGCEACRFACCAIEQVRARHQRANGTHARSRRAYAPPTDRRRGDRMRRREFITLLGGAGAAWPLAARAQHTERMRRIGVLLPAAADDLEWQARVGTFLQALALLGWTIGRNVRIDTRWATSNAGEIRKHAAELAVLAPDVILTHGSGPA